MFLRALDGGIRRFHRGQRGEGLKNVCCLGSNSRGTWMHRFTPAPAADDQRGCRWLDGRAGAWFSAFRIGACASLATDDCRLPCRRGAGRRHSCRRNGLRRFPATAQPSMAAPRHDGAGQSLLVAAIGAHRGGKESDLNARSVVRAKLVMVGTPVQRSPSEGPNQSSLGGSSVRPCWSHGEVDGYLLVCPGPM